MRPHLRGHGPATFSTSLGLMIPFRMVWDVNGYYRELGVPFDATRRQIKEAYQEKCGWASPRLTYILKQLLDPEVRARYDATPLGAVFMDYYVETSLREARARVVSDLRREGLIEVAEMVEEMDDDQELDIASSGDENDRSHPEVWPWSYYLWESECTDTERLRRWQEHLISALGQRKEIRELSIGFQGESKRPWHVRTVGYRTVVFLNDGVQPTEDLAHEASRVI